MASVLASLMKHRIDRTSRIGHHDVHPRESSGGRRDSKVIAIAWITLEMRMREEGHAWTFTSTLDLA